jgi:hypothetical protein
LVICYRPAAGGVLWPGLLLLSLLGCAAGTPTPAANLAEITPATESLPFRLPPLPLDEPQPRAPGETTVASQNGSDALLVSTGTAVSGTDLIISSTAHELEYAIYRFETGLSETGT